MPQLCCHGTVIPFDLPVRLGMVRRGADRFDSQHLYHGDEEVRHELGPFVQQDPVRGPVGGYSRVDDG